MILFTCAARKVGATMPVVTHPCGKAAKALDDFGHSYELRVVGGFKSVPLSRRGRRNEIRRLTGQDDVPVLVPDEGDPIQGSGKIVEWARAHPA